jgi:hypothetical protein
MSEIKLVKMAKDDGSTADVHPSEVENYKLGGYDVVVETVEEVKETPKPKSKK